MSSATEKATIVLVHGLWLTPRSWENWIEHLHKHDHPVLAPAWPGVAELDEPHDPDRAPADIGVTDIADHYIALIDKLPRPPIVIGHSFGGLIAQILLDRCTVVAAVAISPAPAKGVYRLPPAALRTSSVALRNPANLRRAVKLTPEQWHYSFTNTLTKAESLAAYERYAIPGPGRPLFQAATANFNPKAATKVDFGNPQRGPLLLLAATEDHTVPASMVKEAYNRHRTSPARTDFLEFAGRDHFTAGGPGWEEVADAALRWVGEVAGTRTSAP